MTKKERLFKFESFLTALSKASWRDSDQLIDEYVPTVDEKTFDDIFFSNEVYEGLLYRSKLRSWTADKVLTSLLAKYKHKSDILLKKSDIDSLRSLILSGGLYSSVATLDYVARNNVGEIQFVAAQFCSIEALRDLKTSESAKVRKVVFQRLGPVECLDLMLSDKKADIREEGVRMAPFGYEKLNNMTKEIARGPFSQLIGKISSEYLPMLLANRNLKNQWVSRMLQSRLLMEDNDNV